MTVSLVYCLEPINLNLCVICVLVAGKVDHPVNSSTTEMSLIYLFTISRFHGGDFSSNESRNWELESEEDYLAGVRKLVSTVLTRVSRSIPQGQKQRGLHNWYSSTSFRECHCPYAGI